MSQNNLQAVDLDGDASHWLYWALWAFGSAGGQHTSEAAVPSCAGGQLLNRKEPEMAEAPAQLILADCSS